MVTRVLNTLKLKCINWIGGCPAIEEYKNITKHEENCPYKSTTQINYGNKNVHFTEEEKQEQEIEYEPEENEYERNDIKKYVVDVKVTPQENGEDIYELEVSYL